MSESSSRIRSLQWLKVCVACFSVIPVAAGLAGMVAGTDMLQSGMSNLALNSHFSYLSGLLLGIGLGFYSCIPQIETKTARFQLLTIIVFIGGLARLVSLILIGVPSLAMLGALMMELVVTPLLCFWQSRLQATHHL